MLLNDPSQLGDLEERIDSDLLSDLRRLKEWWQ